MARLYLIRHGEAAASYGEADDPGLSARGRDQAAEAARTLARLRPCSAICSPMQRCRETAAAYEALTGGPVSVHPEIGEIPTPAGREVDRQVWLRGLMAGFWRDAPEFTPWRTRLLETLKTAVEDLAVFSHFVAINVAVGAALGSDRVVSFMPANASITVLESAGGRLDVISLGAQTPHGQIL